VSSLYQGLAERLPDAQLIETHISSVLLAGDRAYKIKKPLNLGFLDFSTLALRRHFCEEEIRLNGRLEPDIYLDVVPITGDLTSPALDGPGDVIEYAVQMRRFAQDGLLSEHPQRLTPPLLQQIARRLAVFHDAVARCGDDQPYGSPERVLRPMLENFKQIRALQKAPEVMARLDYLEAWTRSRFQALESCIAGRRQEGHVRECHGDLHLGNMAAEGGRLIIFDGIEFNPNLRWIDTISELAFLLMDLDEKGHSAAGWRLLDDYLQITGDYPGLRLLRFYQCYRAMVRAKVEAIRLQQEGSGSGPGSQFSAYLRQAEADTRPPHPGLLITHGFSGSGKSTVSQQLLMDLPAIRLRSDVERKRLAGMQARQQSGAAAGAGIYSAEFSRLTYARLRDLAEVLLQAGFTVIVDATFLNTDQRLPFRQLAEQLGAPFLILDLQVPEAELRRRVALRTHQGSDVSEADLKILERQLAAAVPLAEEERRAVWAITPSRPLDSAALREFLDGKKGVRPHFPYDMEE